MSSEAEQFTLEIDGKPIELFRVTGRVAVCELFQFHTVAATDLDGPAAEDLLGKPFVLKLSNAMKEELTIRGVVTAVSCELGDDLLAFDLQLGPDAAPLTLGADSYVFQEMTVKEIVADVLDSAGLASDAVEWRLRGQYPKRPYTAQYAESDWHFIERLLVEEGIYYFFEIGEDATKLVFADASSAADPIEGAFTLPCRESSALHADEAAVYEVRSASAIVSEAVRVTDYNYSKPQLKLDSKTSDNKRFEIYDYPGRFLDAARGDALAKIRLESLCAEQATVTGQTGVLRVVAGRYFEVSEHALDGLNARYFCVATEYVARQRGQGEDAEGLQISWKAIPFATPYRPRPEVVWREMAGPQAGVVCGPSGSELHTSDSGQIRVQFYWDRAGKRDQAASTWMRVGQFAVGNSMVVPRIGWEVLAEHHAGDVDQPFVSTHLYDGEHPVPYALPANKTRTAWQTATSPGDGSSNEIRFEDASGKEEMFLNASKDMNVIVGDSKTKSVGADHTHTIGANNKISVGSNASLSVVADQSVSVGAAEMLTVSGDRHTTIGGSETISVGAARMCTVSDGATLDVKSARSLTVGAAMMDVSALGVNRMTMGSMSVTVGGAWISAAGAGLMNMTAGSSSETVGGAKIQAGGQGVALNVKGALAETVGAAYISTAGSNAGESAGGALNINVGGAFIGNAPKILIEAKSKICITVGGTSLTITSSSIELKSPALASPGATIKKDGSKVARN